MRWWTATLISSLFVMAAHAALAQTGLRVVRDGHERWMHAQQPSAFTPFQTTERTATIDSVIDRDGKRTAYIGGDLGPKSRFVLDGGGHVMQVESSGLDLAAEVAWELTVSFHPARAERGQRWLDTLSFENVNGRSLKSIQGVRTSVIVGDTVVDGHRLWIIRDSALVDVLERQDQEERTAGIATMEHRARGTIIGRSLYDAELRLFRSRDDTSAFAGTGVLRYPDGRTFTTAARFEENARYRLYDPIEFRRYTASQSAAHPGSMLIEPEGTIEQRLAAHDTLFRDSVLGAWDRSRDPDERATLARALMEWSFRTFLLPERMRDMALRCGDTTTVIGDLERSIYGCHLTSVAELELLLPFMKDPGRAFAFGLPRDDSYENLVQGLLADPPAMTPDISAWVCTPAACRLLAAQWDQRTDERLRDLALVARFVVDPKRWVDTLVARARLRPLLLAGAAASVRGEIGSAGLAVPSTNAPWTSWATWLMGQSTASLATMQKAGLRVPDGADNVDFGPARIHAVRWQELLTGRNITAELTRELAVTANDSARYIYRTMLLGLGALRVNPDSVARRFTGGSRLDQAMATRELGLLMAQRPPPADSATTDELIDHIIGMQLNEAPPWPFLVPARARTLLDVRPYGQYYLVVANVPARVRQARSSRMVLVDSIGTWPPDRRPAKVVSVGPVSAVGRFARVSLSVVSFAAPSGGGAQGITCYLMKTNDGWVIVSFDAFMT